MNLPLTWQRRLKTREPDLIVLVTVNPFGIDPMTAPHLALSPGSVRLATEAAHPVLDGMTLPFAPWVLAWPEIAEQYDPADRRYEIAQTTVSVASGAGLGDVLLQAGGGQTATCRIDLWPPRMSLADAIPLIAGPVRGVPQIAERYGAVQFQVTDGDPDRVVEWPAGQIDRSEFPGAPDHVAGKRQRQWILGGYPWQVGCPQIDEDGLVYYVHERAFTARPTRFWNNGVPILTPPAVEVIRTAASGEPITVLRFAAKPETPTGLQPQVSCAGGRGVEEAHPALFLLQTVGGYRLTPRARATLARSPFAFDFLANSRGDVRRIVTDQLLPQTDLVATFRRGQVDVLPLAATQSEMRLGIGYGLRYRHADQDGESPLSSVYNAFEIKCGRVGTSGDAALLTIRRDADHGPAEIRSLLARSQRAYGRRAITWPALDLAVDRSGSALSCPSGELLGDILARAHSFPWRPHRYRATWLEGMAVEIGQRVYLTDAAESLDDAPVIVTGRRILPTGVDLTLSAQAEPSRLTVTQRRVYA